MKNYFEELEKKIREKINIEEIVIVDNSSKHKNHKTFSPGKLHLHLKIKSIYLKSISKLNAHKLVMRVLKDELENRVHALEISIEK